MFFHNVLLSGKVLLNTKKIMGSFLQRLMLILHTLGCLLKGSCSVLILLLR
jgi:hypothetical protein